MSPPLTSWLQGYMLYRVSRPLVRDMFPIGIRVLRSLIPVAVIEFADRCDCRISPVGRVPADRHSINLHGYALESEVVRRRCESEAFSGHTAWPRDPNVFGCRSRA